MTSHAEATNLILAGCKETFPLEGSRGVCAKLAWGSCKVSKLDSWITGYHSNKTVFTSITALGSLNAELDFEKVRLLDFQVHHI